MQSITDLWESFAQDAAEKASSSKRRGLPLVSSHDGLTEPTCTEAAYLQISFARKGYYLHSPAGGLLRVILFTIVKRANDVLCHLHWWEPALWLICDNAEPMQTACVGPRVSLDCAPTTKKGTFIFRGSYRQYNARGQWRRTAIYALLVGFLEAFGWLLGEGVQNVNEMNPWSYPALRSYR